MRMLVMSVEQRGSHWDDAKLESYSMGNLRPLKPSNWKSICCFANPAAAGLRKPILTFVPCETPPLLSGSGSKSKSRPSINAVPPVGSGAGCWHPDPRDWFGRAHEP